jgi:hypothetical protein
MAFEEALKHAGSARMMEAQRAVVLGEPGLSELAQRKYREAAEHLSESLDHDTALPRASREAFHQGMREAGVGRLYVTVTPSDAALLLDGERIGTGATWQWPTNRCKNPEPPPECAAIRGAFERKDIWNTAGWVALGGAAALGGATLASVFVARGSIGQGGVRVAPAVAGDRVGMVVLGAW